MFYAEKPSHSWLPERLVDWLAVNILPFYFVTITIKFYISLVLKLFVTSKQFVSWQDYDSLFSGTHPTVHSKLVDFQKEFVNLQVLNN